MATDEQLAAAMECERSVYVSGDDAVRKAFAPASIAKWTSSTYEGSDRTKYHEGTLKEGDQAPDFDLHQLEAPNQPLKSCKLLSFLPKDKKYLVLNFGRWRMLGQVHYSSTVCLHLFRFNCDAGSFS